ncbi:MAG: carbohydrate-binding protein [Sporocytophaga sp.]|uniref:pectinesterase family protein n=1 Tax=Sporocytophaga sp. TaxID=2231183 RepID=UPI001B2EC5B3|nr:pectinesterase family protein [Sporocytophaga sp.]MBO9703327.1 carbohydrate-binding protein [Sporocytophaga sp.]
MKHLSITEYIQFRVVKIVLALGLLLNLPFSNNAQTLVPVDNAVNVSNDMQFRLSFSTIPTLQSSGKISLYRSNNTLVETIDLSKMPTGTPMSGTWPWIETLNGTDIRVIPVTVDGKSVYIRFSIGAMDFSTGYYITIDKSVFSNASSLSFNGITANNWSFTTRSKPATDLDYTVSADGTGDFATLQGALDFLPTGNANAKILVKNGTYIGLAYIKGKNKYTIEGESRTGVIIKGYNNSNLNASTHWRSVVNIQGDDISLISLTFINTTPNGGTQAEALKASGARMIIANCEFYSYQDTVLLDGKVYVKDCMLEGDVDFIWGTGAVFFQSCEIRANDNGGYNVMARNNNTVHGYAFADCKLTRTSSATTTHYLGRDAGASYPYAEIVYLNCTLGPHIPAVGWSLNSSIDASNIIFAEYKSVNESGTLINTSGRNSKSKQLSASQANQYRDLNWFFNGWVPVVPAYGVKDCNGVIGGSAFKDDCATCVGGTTGKTACVKDCNGVANGTATLDNCGRCIGGTTGKLACISVGEAEDDACSFDGVLESKNVGFKGTAYLNVDNAIGTRILFSINASSSGNKIISFRYANGGNTDRPATIKVDGTTLSSTLSFPSTGEFTTYKAVDLTLNISSGSHFLELISATADGLPNIDQIGFVSSDLSKGSCEEVVTAIAEESKIPLIVIYPNPSQGSFHIKLSVPLNIEITDAEGKTLKTYDNILELEFGNDLQQGLYFAKVQNKVYKFVKY